MSTMVAVRVAEAIASTSFASDSAIDAKVKDKLASLMFGVPLRYSCPVPLVLPDDEEDWSASEKEIVESLTEGVVADCKRLAREVDVLATNEQELFEQLFILNERFPKLIIYPGYASGDMYGIGASLILDPTLRILVLKDAGKTGRIDRTASVKKFLSESIDASRIAEDSAEPSAFAFIPPFDTQSAPQRRYLTWLSEALWNYIDEKRSMYLAVDLFFGTNYIARQFSAGGLHSLKLRGLIRQSWQVDEAGLRPAMRERLEEHLVSYGFETESGEIPRGKKIVVLWVRFTGKTGGAHVEYDTSFTGIEQLLKLAADQGVDWAILVGDRPKASAAFDEAKAKRRPRKIWKIALEAPLPTLDLTEFWNEPEWKECFSGSAKRIDQWKLLEVLHRANRVRHFGARSGNLESLALLGYDVNYFEDEYGEEEEALDKKRMESWHETVGYRRIQLSTVPTRSGKYLLESDESYPAWTYDRRKAKGAKKYLKPPAVLTYPKGFSLVDLQKLTAFFKPSAFSTKF